MALSLKRLQQKGVTTEPQPFYEELCFVSVFLKIALSVICTGFLIVGAQPGLSQDMLTVEADDSLEWNQAEGFYKANGNAVAVQGEQNLKGDVLIAYYTPTGSSRDFKRILAEGNVSFKDGGISGTGATADYDLTKRRYVLSGPNASISGPDGQADAEKQIDFERDAAKIYLQDNARIKLSDGRKLFGDSITVFLDDKENVSRVIASGDVEVIQKPGSSATGDEADYDHKANITILTGNVTMIDGENKLFGDVAEIDFSTGISKMVSSSLVGRVSGQFSRLIADTKK